MTHSLLDAVEAFLSAHNMPAATFGRMAMRDPHFVRDLRNGRRVFAETESKVRTFMESQAEEAASSEKVAA